MCTWKSEWQSYRSQEEDEDQNNVFAEECNENAMGKTNLNDTAEECDEESENDVVKMEKKIVFNKITWKGKCDLTTIMSENEATN